jgi:cell division protein FtsL
MTAATMSVRPPRRRVLWIMLAAVTVIAALFIGVYPTRTYFSQRSQLQKAQHQLTVLDTENAKLDQSANDLNTDARIEQLARERYNLVRPGEEAFAILPAPPRTIAVPPVWPFTGLAQRVDPGAATSHP